jgi:PBP1b-binding outer membrane lipoprotein LpoB
MNKIIFVLLVSLVFVSGCLEIKETRTETADEHENITYEQQNIENSELDELSEDISDVENLDNNLDKGDLADIEYDLGNIDW